MGGAEIRHSLALVRLFDANATHEIGDVIIKRFL